MKKLFVTLGIAAMVAGSATAQELAKNNYDNDQLGTTVRVTRYGPYLTGRFFDNWFVGVGGGVNLYNPNDVMDKADFGDRITPAVNAFAGKWFTPTFGVRLAYNGIRAKSTDPRQPREVGDTRLREFNTMFFHADLMWNISNSIGGYRSDRTWDVVPYAGFGYARASKDSDAFKLEENKMAATAGIYNKFRLGGVVDLFLDASYMLVDDAFDGFQADKRYEGMASLTAGITFKLGPKEGFKRPTYTAPADYTPYQRRIDALEGDVAREKAAIDRLRRELEAERNKDKSTVVEKVFTPVTISSFFGIGNAQVAEKEMVNIENAAAAMKAQPNARFNVTGYADSATGSAKRNQELSEMRAENVAKILVEKFGVSRSQLNVSGKGGVSNHTNPALDRVVVIE